MSVAEVAVAGAPAALALLLVIEAGIPFPIPADLVVLLIGARVSAGGFPLWLAIGILELAAAAGTTALFLTCRGPGHATVRRLGRRIGLTDERLDRVRALLERRGAVAIAIGRATPGLRTVTVVATGTSGLSLRLALPALFVGSTIFLQVHLVLGMILGPAAAGALDRARLPVLLALAAVVVVSLVVWLRRRGGRGGEQAWAEAGCPVCAALGGIALSRSGDT